MIGVDPDFQGLGLGTQLTLAGLDHMVAAGMTEALLYVAAENTAATAMYERLGFDGRIASTGPTSARCSS